MKAFVEPVTVREATRIVGRVHRRHSRLRSAMWALALTVNERVVGVATVGLPKARLLMVGARRLEVTRVAVEEGHPNACSMLYGAVARAARAMGAVDLFTYTHSDEEGGSVRGAGWIREVGPDGKPMLFGGGRWDRPSRPRNVPEDDGPKHRWWAPWSAFVLTAAFATRHCA